ncbi:MAG TPA: DMT family transporter, partial [Geminicoccaceae bacterium]|nr:DMT family transporter [Geminicoccaceae bacterium]
MTTLAPNLRAALFVTLAMASFCVNDAFVKALSARTPIGEIMAVRGVFAVALMAALLPWMGLRVGRPERFTWLRAAGEVSVTFVFLEALAALPLGDTYTLYFAGPILLTAGAAFFYGERVGPRRWAAVLVGFAGVLVAMGLPSEWQLASLLALGAALLSVARDLVTRKIPASVGSGTVAMLTAVLVTLSGTATALGGEWVPLAWRDVGLRAGRPGRRRRVHRVRGGAAHGRALVRRDLPLHRHPDGDAARVRGLGRPADRAHARRRHPDHGLGPVHRLARAPGRARPSGAGRMSAVCRFPWRRRRANIGPEPST